MKPALWLLAAYASAIVTTCCFAWLLACKPKASDILVWLMGVSYVLGVGGWVTARFIGKLRDPPR